MKNLISGPSIERTIRMSYKDLQSEVLFKSEPYSSALRTPSATSLDKRAPVCGVWHRTPPPPELDGVFFLAIYIFWGGGTYSGRLGTDLLCTWSKFMQLPPSVDSFKRCKTVEGRSRGKWRERNANKGVEGRNKTQTNQNAIIFYFFLI